MGSSDVALHRVPAIGLTILVFALLGAGASDQPPRRPVVGGDFTYTVRRGDSLSLIGARFGVSVAALARRNARSAGALIHPGETLLIDNRHIVPSAADVEIVINVPQRLLFLFGGDGRLRAHYPVGLGRPDWPTPLGDFQITEVERDPTWDVPASIQDEMRREGKPVVQSMPPCPQNPLGRYWLRLSFASLGIHGTNAPASVYSFATHGCIRLHPDHIEALSTNVRPGSRGRLIYEPVLVTADEEGRVFAEVHRDVYRRAPEPMAALRGLARAEGLHDAVDWDAAAQVARLAEGVATSVGRRGKGGGAVLVRARMAARESPRAIAE
jgi:L,D-transpeptidase ErfK/SrfK